MKKVALILPALLASSACSVQPGRQLEMIYGVRVGDRPMVRFSGTTLYAGPDFRSARALWRLRRDERVEVLEEPVMMNGHSVVKVKTRPGGRVGWIKTAAVARLTWRTVSLPVARKRPAASSSAETPPADTPNIFMRRKLRTVGAGGAVLKREARLNAESGAQLEKGTVVRVTGPAVEAGGVRWVPVEMVNVTPARRGFLPQDALD